MEAKTNNAEMIGLLMAWFRTEFHADYDGDNVFYDHWRIMFWSEIFWIGAILANTEKHL